MSKKTGKVWGKSHDLIVEEIQKGIIDVETKKVSGINNFAPGYLDKENEVIVGFQTDAPLKRIVNSGDPVQSVVQKVVKNYTQIGSEERWKPVEGSHYFSHRMMVYLDTAIRNYYDARDAYEKSGGHIPENIPGIFFLCIPSTVVH